MKIKLIKIFFLVWFINLLENLALLFVYGVNINLRSLIGAGIFALVLSLFINKFLLKE